VWETLREALARPARLKPSNAPVSWRCQKCDVFGQGRFPVSCWMCGDLEQLEGKAIPTVSSGQSFGPYRPPGAEDLSALSWGELLAGVDIPDAEVTPQPPPEEDEW
jgi:hypothetical protein